MMGVLMGSGAEDTDTHGGWPHEGRGKAAVRMTRRLAGPGSPSQPSARTNLADI